MNPVLKSPWIEEMIKAEFSLSDEAIEMRFIADGSAHYEYLWRKRRLEAIDRIRGICEKQLIELYAEQPPGEAAEKCSLRR